MGRFYKGKDATFSKDMFELPTDVFADTLKIKEAQAKAFSTSTDLLNTGIESIPHLNNPVDNARVQEKKAHYNAEIDKITKLVQANPENAGRYSQYLRQIQRNFSEDMSSGDLYSIQQRHTDYNKWYNENKGLSKNNPELFNRINNHNIQDIEAQSGEDNGYTFQGNAIIDRPDLSSPAMTARFNRIKANLMQNRTADGKYIIEGQIVDANRVNKIAMKELLSDPNYAGYMKQMASLGDEGFLDAAGNPVSIENEQGELNEAHPFYNDISAVGDTYGYSQTKAVATPEYKQSLQEQSALKLIEARGNVAKEKLAKQQGYKSANALIKASNKERTNKAKKSKNPKVANKAVAEDLFFGKKQSISDPEKVSANLKEYVTLLNTQVAKLENPEATIENKDLHKLEELNMMFAPLTTNKEFTNKLFKSYGMAEAEYPTTDKARRNRVMQILADTQKLGDSDWGYGPVYIVPLGKTISTRRDKLPERENAEKALETFELNGNTLAEKLSKDLEVSSLFKGLGSSESSDFSLLKNLVQRNPLAVIRDGNISNQSYGDEDLDKQKTMSQDGYMFDDAARNPIGHIMKETGKTLEELVDEGYISVSHKPYGATGTSILWTLQPKLNESGIEMEWDEDDSNVTSFTTSYANVDVNSLYPPGNTPQERQLYLESKYGKEYTNVSNKIDFVEAFSQKETSKNFYPKGYPINLPGTNNSLFFLKQKDNGSWSLSVEAKNDPENTYTWEKYTNLAEIKIFLAGSRYSSEKIKAIENAEE